MIHVVDELENVDWGPFESDWDAERFIQSDKYLQSWAFISRGRRSRKNQHFRPVDYHGRWPL